MRAQQHARGVPFHRAEGGRTRRRRNALRDPCWRVSLGSDRPASTAMLQMLLARTGQQKPNLVGERGKMLECPTRTSNICNTSNLSARRNHGGEGRRAHVGLRPTLCILPHRARKTLAACRRASGTAARRNICNIMRPSGLFAGAYRQSAHGPPFASRAPSRRAPQTSCAPLD